jgi:poly(3-hydroxybutyrate) depolymerase
LCVNIPADRKAHWLQHGVGHYGVFNGSRFRSEIAPRIADFVLSMHLSGRTRRNGQATRLAYNGGSTPPDGEPAAAAGDFGRTRID